MTFSIIARCPGTGAFGAAIATSDLAVGGRCVRLAHGVGAVLSQHRTDSRIGDLGLSLLHEGLDAPAVMDALRATAPGLDWRQIGVLDAKGGWAVHHGRLIYSIHGHAGATDCLALGNILDNDRVPVLMTEAFAMQGRSMGHRLLRALEAGRDAGGEVLGPLRSAALRVTGADGLDAIDLRVDMSDGDAVADLCRLFDCHGPRAEALRRVALEPDAVPVSRALFEASTRRIAALGLEDRFPAARRRDDWSVGD